MIEALLETFGTHSQTHLRIYKDFFLHFISLCLRISTLISIHSLSFYISRSLCRLSLVACR